MKTGLSVAAALIIGASVCSGSQAAPLTREDFQVETTANLVALCAAPQADPLYTAAQNFCHGFSVATYRAIAMQQMATRVKHKLFCMPSNPPSRDQAIAAFVQWANGKPKTLASAPTDSIAEYLAETYPCR